MHDRTQLAQPHLINRGEPEHTQVVMQSLADEPSAPDTTVGSLPNVHDTTVGSLPNVHDTSVGGLPGLPRHEEDFDDDDEGKMHEGVTEQSQLHSEAAPEQKVETHGMQEPEIPDRNSLGEDASRQSGAQSTNGTSAPVLQMMQDMATVVQDLKDRVHQAECDNQSLRHEALVSRKEYRPFQGSQMLGLAEPWIADRYIAQELKRHALFGDPISRQPEPQRSRELRLMLFSLLVDSLGEW